MMEDSLTSRHNNRSHAEWPGVLDQDIAFFEP